MLDFFCNGCQRQQIIIIIGRFIFYQRLSSRTADIILSLILQNILHGIRLVIIPNNSTWERHLSCFNGIIAMINSYNYRNHILSFFLFNVRSKMLSLLQRIVAKVPFVNTFLCSSVPKPAENLAFLYHYRQRNTTVPSQPVIKDPSPGGGSACPGEGYIASFLFEQLPVFLFL